MDEVTKSCAACGTDKPYSEFHKDSRKPDGRRSRCKLCTNADQRAFQQKHKAETGQYATRKYRYDCTCIACGRTWPAARSKAKFCSTVCQAEYEHGVDRIIKADRRGNLRRRRAMRKLRKAAEGTRGTVPFVAGRCGSCGAPIVSTRSETRWCSPACKARQRQARRRARKRDAYVADVSPLKIFERDRWRCQLCRKPVDRSKVVPHPQAPVIDHVIPLACGGTHEPANAQCAHFICNSIKSDRGGGEQLMLIG